MEIKGDAKLYIGGKAYDVKDVNIAINQEKKPYGGRWRWMSGFVTPVIVLSIARYWPFSPRHYHEN